MAAVTHMSAHRVPETLKKAYQPATRSVDSAKSMSQRRSAMGTRANMQAAGNAPTSAETALMTPANHMAMTSGVVAAMNDALPSPRRAATAPLV
jgi:hypothetical protein